MRASGQRWRLWVAFAALCLLQGSGWLVDSYWPSPLPLLAGQAVRDALLAVCLVVVTARGRASWGLGGWVRFSVAGWAALLLVLPGWLATMAHGTVSGFTAALVATLVPAAVVFVVAQGETGFGAERQGLERLGPALAGFGGAALLLPYVLPGSVAGRLWLSAMLAAAVISGVAIVRLHEAFQRGDLLLLAALVCAAACVAASVGEALAGGGVMPSLHGLAAHDLVLWVGREVAVTALLDAPVVLLTVWLLRELRPVAFSVVSLMVPVVSVGEAFLLMRPVTDWTLPAGVALVLGASVTLLYGAGD